jgi:hypothetical protein
LAKEAIENYCCPVKIIKDIGLITSCLVHEMNFLGKPLRLLSSAPGRAELRS